MNVISVLVNFIHVGIRHVSRFNCLQNPPSPPPIGWVAGSGEDSRPRDTVNCENDGNQKHKKTKRTEKQEEALYSSTLLHDNSAEVSIRYSTMNSNQ